MQTILFAAIVLAFGVVFEKYYFCMNSAITDVFIGGDTRRLRGLVTAVLVSAILFNSLIGLGVIKATRWPLFATAIVGGIIFGIGMNLAGGCVSGTLFKMGQGHIASVIAFLGIILGLATMGLAMSLMTMAGSGAKPLLGATLPKLLGTNPLIFTGIAAGISIAAFIFWKKKSGKTKEISIPLENGEDSRLKIKSPNFIIGGLLIAVLNTILFVVRGMPLMMSGLMIYIPSRMAYLVDRAWASKNPMFGGFLAQPDYIMMTMTGVLFMAGAFFSALAARRFRLRLPVWRQALSSLVGGFLMGMSIPLMWGCNVTHILGNVPQFSIASMVSTAGIVLGAWLGVKLTFWIVAHR